MSDRWEISIAKLIELTRARVLIWQKSNGLGPRDVDLPGLHTTPYPAFRRDNLCGLPYFTTHLQKHLALYESRYPTYDDEGGDPWGYSPTLEFVAPGGELEFLWPERPQTRELLGVVRHVTSGATEFIDALLGAEVPSAKDKSERQILKNPTSVALINSAISVLQNNRDHMNGGALLREFRLIVGRSKDPSAVFIANNAIDGALRRQGFDPLNIGKFFTLEELRIVAQDACFGLE
jgi:hypothetical protein